MERAVLRGIMMKTKTGRVSILCVLWRVMGMREQRTCQVVANR